MTIPTTLSTFLNRNTRGPTTLARALPNSSHKCHTSLKWGFEPKMLGVQIDEHLAWTKHIEFIAGKISSGIGAIKKEKEFVDRNTLVLIYNALVQPHFDYCCEVWDVLGKTLTDRLQKLQDMAVRIIMNFKNESG